MKHLSILLLILLSYIAIPLSVSAQFVRTQFVSTIPTACPRDILKIVSSTLYFPTAAGGCIGTGAGGGSVNSVASGNLSPLFTVGIANPSTDPTFTFTLSTAAAHRFFGNNTGSSAPPGFQQVMDADLGLTDVTTNNASTSNHGFLPKLNNSATQFINGQGAWATPPANGVILFNIQDYGIFCDGVTNHAAAIQAVMDAAELVNGTVWHPVSLFPCLIDTTQVAFDAGDSVGYVGEALWGSRLKYNGSGFAMVLDKNGIMQHPRVSNIWFDLTGAAATAGGLHARQTYWGEFTNIKVRSSSGAASCEDGIGIQLDNDADAGAWSPYNIIYNPDIDGDMCRGIKLTGTSAAFSPNITHIFGGFVGNESVSKTGSIGIDIDLADSVRIYGTDLSTWGTCLRVNGNYNGPLTPRFEGCTVDWRVETGWLGNDLFGSNGTAAKISDLGSRTRYTTIDGPAHLPELTLATPLSTPNGGTGLASGTSGGVPYFSSTTAITSSGALVSGQFVLGGGAGGAPTTSFSLVPSTNGGFGADFSAAAAHSVPVSNGASPAVFVAKVMPSCLDTGGNHINYNQSTSTFSCGTSSGAAGSGGGIDGWSALSIVSFAVTATQYTPFSGGGPDSATEASVQVANPAAATISKLRVSLDAALGASATATVTLRVAGADAALTCVTASGGTTCSDATNSVNLSAGDLVNFKVVATGTVTAATPIIKIIYAVGTSGVGTTSVSFTGGLISVANPTTTPALTVAGTSGGIPYFASASTWASSAALGAGQFILGGGAGNSPTASFSVVPVASGGSGAATLTGLLQGNGTSAFTVIVNSTTVGQVLRVTGSNAYGWGALDLADTDAVTGVLPAANHPAMSTTAAGIVEAAIASEVNSGSSTTLAVTPQALATSSVGQKAFTVLVSADFTTNTATGDGQAYWPVPAIYNAWRIVDVEGKVTTVGTTNTTNVDIALCRAVATGSPCSGTVVDVLSTNSTIDSNEDGTETAAAARVIDLANDDLATGDWLRFDVDAISTTPAKGLMVIVTLGI